MATRKVDIGPVGEAVRANLAKVREDRHMTLRDLSEQMGKVGRPMSYGTIGEIERGARRCDVDDLAALSEALECSPMYLLGQSTMTNEEMMNMTWRLLLDTVDEMMRKGMTPNGND